MAYLSITRMQQGSTIAIAKPELYFTFATDFGKFMGRYGYIDQMDWDKKQNLQFEVRQAYSKSEQVIVRFPPLKTKGSLTVTPISTLTRFLYNDPTFNPNPLILMLARTPT